MNGVEIEPFVADFPKARFVNSTDPVWRNAWKYSALLIAEARLAATIRVAARRIWARIPTRHKM